MLSVSRLLAFRSRPARSYSWRCGFAADVSLAVCRSIWKVSTLAKKKSWAKALPAVVVVTPEELVVWVLVPVVVNAKDPVGLGGETVLS